MRRIVVVAAVALAALPTLADVTPGQVTGPDLMVQKPVVTQSPWTGWTPSSAWSATWVVRNVGSHSSPATQLKVTCTPIYVEGKAECATPQMVSIPPLAAGDSYTTPATGVFGVVWNGTQTQRWRVSIVATVNPMHTFAEIVERNNQVGYTIENFEGPAQSADSSTVSKYLPPPKTSAASPINTAAPQVSTTPAVSQILPHMELTTDPKAWSFKAPFWVVLKNVDSSIDAKNIVVTAKCVSQGATLTDPCGPIVSDSHASTTVPSLAHGSFKALYQIDASSWIGLDTVSAMTSKITIHVNNANATDLVLTGNFKK